MTDWIFYALLSGIALINLGLLIAWFIHHDRLLKGLPGLFAPSWSLFDVFIGFQIMLLLLVVLLGIALNLFKYFSPMPAFEFENLADFVRGSRWGWALLASLVVLQNGAMVGLASVLVQARFKERWDRLGLHWPPSKKEIVFGLITGIALVIIVLLVENALDRMSQIWTKIPLMERLAREDFSTKVVQDLFRSLSLSPSARVGIFFFAVIIAPISEEILFRGLLYNAFRHRLGAGWAAPLSGAIFAFAHVSFVGFLPRWLIGWFLADSYRRSGSLWVPIFAHMMNNLVALWLMVDG